VPNYRISKRAASDINEIASFTLERWGEEQVDRYLSGLEALFHIIAGRPMMGRSAAQVLPNLRRVEHISHIVFYMTVPGGISIERILHKSRALKKKDFRS
jgi:toxin ParE1/3/4